MNTGELHQCPVCHLEFRVDLFNAFFRPPRSGQPGQATLEQGMAECFYHPGKKAVGACASCGRLLCDLCNIEWHESNLCMKCLQVGKSKRKIASLENDRILYDTIALSVAAIPLLSFWIFTIITGPAAIFLALRYWKTPLSIIPRTRIRFLLAILIGGGEVWSWAVILAGLFS